MADIRALIAGLLIKWSQETYVLLRIRIIVAFLAMLYIIMFIFSGIIYFSMRKSMLSLLDAVTDSVIAYVLGAMQAAPFKNQMFPVWALLLVGFRSSVNTLSRYGTYFELRNVLKLLAVAYMNVTHGSKFWRIPFWLCWSLMALNSFYRIMARYLASKSLWHSRSSELLQEYMGANSDRSNFNPERCNPETMEGYKYLVYGESKQSRKAGHAVSVRESRSLITLDKIWRNDGPFLQNNTKLKYLSLAFALSRLLRCRLEGATLHADVVSMTQKLICSLICADDTEDVLLFQILELDLEFLSDYLHTRYPMVFWEGLLSLYFTLILSFMKYSAAIWLLMEVSNVYLPYTTKGVKVFRTANSYDTDMYITNFIAAVIWILELMEMVTYFISKWTILLLVCDYVSCRNGSMIRALFKIIARLFIVLRKSRERRLGQYDFLQSFNYKVSKWNLVASKGDGMQLLDSIRLEKLVKVVVIHALARSMEDRLPVPRDLPLPRASDRRQRYQSACLQLPPRCSRVILVWHIATSLCETKLAQDHQNDSLTKPGSFSFLENEKRLSGELKRTYVVAISLSRYCAYLLVSKPDLLPETILASKKVLLQTLQDARETLEHCDSFQSRYDRLLAMSQEAAVSGSQDIKLSGNILQQGAILANELIDNEDEEHRWDILAKVWADLLVHIAPSSNAEAHAKHLESGGELITLIWALFCHCGIEKSKMWAEDAAAGVTLQDHLRRNDAADARGQETVTAAPPAAARNGQGGHLEDLEDTEIIVETIPTPSGTS